MTGLLCRWSGPNVQVERLGFFSIQHYSLFIDYIPPHRNIVSKCAVHIHVLAVQELLFKCMKLLVCCSSFKMAYPNRKEPWCFHGFENNFLNIFRLEVASSAIWNMAFLPLIGTALPLSNRVYGITCPQCTSRSSIYGGLVWSI